ncbi:MarR family winged helix-turn-helix transcriptional regulator [Methanobrevibacter sp.]|uniref:MarR family winged helix-turn-helix transcriptional regulator n=1 Tax=Methanobrevibacter sp. TaxID=66852 RepID=UPI00386E46A4
MDEKIFENAPFIAWIHNISKNQLKYLNLKLADLELDHDIRHVIYIYDNPNISQDDLVGFSGQSKGNIAKVVKKLEDRGYIEREINPNNRRKYMLKTTSKADELVPKIREISKEWEREVGLTDNDDEIKKRIREISINSMKLIGE